MATQLIALARDASMREHLREAGLERAKRFSWEATARKTLEVYAEVLEEARAGR